MSNEEFKTIIEEFNKTKQNNEIFVIDTGEELLSSFNKNKEFYINENNKIFNLKNKGE